MLILPWFQEKSGTCSQDTLESSLSVKAAEGIHSVALTCPAATGLGLPSTHSVCYGIRSRPAPSHTCPASASAKWMPSAACQPFPTADGPEKSYPIHFLASCNAQKYRDSALNSSEFIAAGRFEQWFSSVDLIPNPDPRVREVSGLSVQDRQLSGTADRAIRDDSSVSWTERPDTSPCEVGFGLVGC